MITSAATDSVSAVDIPRGIALIAGGIAVAAAGIFWYLDIRGITSRYYKMTIRSWGKIPIFGQGWVQSTPYSRFRLQALIPHTLFGAIMISIGIYLIVG